jgi:hypothetical protein
MLHSLAFCLTHIFLLFLRRPFTWNGDFGLIATRHLDTTNTPRGHPSTVMSACEARLYALLNRPRWKGLDTRLKTIF